MPCTFSASISEGAVSQSGVQSTATLTQFVYDLAALTFSSPLTIPNKAYQVSVVCGNRDYYATVNAEFQYRSPVTTRIAGQWLTSTLATPGLPIPIPQGARFFRLQNTAAAGTKDILSAVWSIGV